MYATIRSYAGNTELGAELRQASGVGQDRDGRGSRLPGVLLRRHLGWRRVGHRLRRSGGRRSVHPRGGRVDRREPPESVDGAPDGLRGRGRRLVLTASSRRASRRSSARPGLSPSRNRRRRRRPDESQRDADGNLRRPWRSGSRRDRHRARETGVLLAAEKCSDGQAEHGALGCDEDCDRSSPAWSHEAIVASSGSSPLSGAGSHPASGSSRTSVRPGRGRCARVCDLRRQDGAQRHRARRSGA